MYTKNSFEYIDNHLDIAYLLGIYLTDGYIVENEKYRSWLLDVTVLDKDICQRVALASQRLFGKNPKIYQRKEHYWCVNVYSRSLVNFLRNNTQDKSILPAFVYEQSREWKLELLSGILDGDGWATFSQNRYERVKDHPYPVTWYCQIGIVGLAENIYLNDVKRLLDQMGVLYRVNYQKPRKEGYLPQQRVLINPQSFLDNGLYFYCKRKTDKVEKFKEYVLSQRSETIRLPGRPRRYSPNCSETSRGSRDDCPPT